MKNLIIIFTFYSLIINITGCTSTEPVRFSAVGDTPYYASDSELAVLSESFDRMAVRNIPFVVHVGDIFRGRSTCTAEPYKVRAKVFATSPIPFLITIGDNEFNDCKNSSEARTFFREIILSDPPLQQIVEGVSSAFEPIHVTRQVGMIENAAWTSRNVDFIMLVLPDLPGNYPLHPDNIRDILEANTVFLVKYFNQARKNNQDAVVLIMHSNPVVCDVPGCDNFYNILTKEVRDFAKPVLLINGSDHSREFIDGGYQEISNLSHLRPGSEPEEIWPEISYLPLSKKFTVKWHEAPEEALE